MRNKLHVAIAKAAKKAYPEEACGFIDGNTVIELKNNSTTPNESFIISALDFLKHEPTSIYHSHPTGDNGFSEQDLSLAATLGLTSYLYVNEADRLEVYTISEGIQRFEKVSKR